jgi:thymidylate synthase
MRYKNATQAFELLFSDINANGESFAGTKAKFNVSFTLQDVGNKIVTTPQRKFNTEYAEYEWTWYLKGDRDATEIAERAKIWKNMMVPGTTEANSNYGYFWNKNDQLQRAITELKSNPQTRRAIVVHYDINELDRYAYDTPCNDVLNFYIKDDALHLTVFARSIDLWFGFVNDQYTFAKLMEMVAFQLDIPVGKMHWFITNCHLYERHWNKL